MKINIVQLAKIAFKNKQLQIKDIGKHRVSVNYLNTDWRGNYNRKPFVFPKHIIVDQVFVEALALFLGDGDNDRIEKNHLSYCSKDKDLIIFFLNFLRSYFNIKNKDLTIHISYRKKDPHIRKKWSTILNFDRQKILTKHSIRHREQTCAIQANGVVFRKLFEVILRKVVTLDLLCVSSFRRAFLRGLFAAEGSVGIDFVSKKPYISQISFSLSLEEKKIKNLICLCLRLEKIRYRVDYNEKNHCISIVICNWNNYLKLWWAGTFNLCKRKKYKFYTIARNINVYPQLSPSFRVKLFKSIHLYQKELAELIESWQSYVSRTIIGQHLLRVEQLKDIIPYSDYTKRDVLKNTLYFRVGSLTKIKPSSMMDSFLYEIKSF